MDRNLCPIEKMIGKAAGSLLIIIIVFLSYSVFIRTLNLNSHFSPQIQPQLLNSCVGEGILRVFMYDLPPRFHVGMIDHRFPDDASVTSLSLPPWPTDWGLKTQHSVEYWLMASLLYEDDGGSSRSRLNVVRVNDPSIADAFFVPFFSSLSFNTHGHNMTDPDCEIDRHLQVEVVDILKKSEYWQRSKGRDHVIPMHHPNAFRFLKEEVNASILIVSDFGRYPRNVSNINKDVVAPYVHVVDSFVDDDLLDPYASRPILLFFKGRMFRKDEGIVRVKLSHALSGFDDVHYENSFATKESIKMTTKGMRSSKFCLHPAGDTPSSCRLFDAIVSHCVPVIVSDRIELPFEDRLDYTTFSLFFSAEDAVRPGHMVERLRAVPEPKWREMWAILKNISHHYHFHRRPQPGDAVDMIWARVHHKLPPATLAANRARRLKVPDWLTT